MPPRGPLTEEHKRKISAGRRKNEAMKHRLSPQGLRNIQAAQRARREREAQSLNHAAAKTSQVALALREMIRAEVQAELAGLDFKQIVREQLRAMTE